MPESGNGSISGWLVDKSTGERLVSPDVRLYHIGVPGEIVGEVDKRGTFSFAGLAEGEYSLGIYDDKFVRHHERMELGASETLKDLRIELTPGGFLSGRILDEDGRPPQSSCFTLLKWGKQRGKIGYHSNSGDHRVSREDGSFISPPLMPGRYYLRFAGILQKLPVADPSKPGNLAVQERIFDFVYPNAYDICGATSFDVESGQTVSGLRIEIRRAVWRRIQGRVTGELPPGQGKFNVIVGRDFGTIDQIGGGGGPMVQPDGTFEHQLQRGRYSAEVWEFGEPTPDGRSTVLRRFGSPVTLTVADEDLSGVEIPLGNEIEPKN